VALPALSACDGCHASKPYTPWKLSEAPDASAQVGVAPVVGGDAGVADGGFTAVLATPAPGDGKSWPLGGGAVEPPAGHTFAEGLVGDVDGDGTPDLVAWARSPDGLRGEVWFASGKAPAAGRTVVALPGELAGPGCGPRASLARLGPGMIALDFDPRCPPHARERGARWIAVLRASSAGGPELGLELRIAAPAEGESIAVALDGRDRDGDGRGDLSATITLSGAPRPFPAGGSAAATLAYFDRPAGLSRDPSEPEASLRALGAGLVSEGRKRTTAPKVAAAALAARRLKALLCDEGRQLVTTSAGPARCGDAKVVDDAAMAETEAALNLGDPLAAIAALGRVEGRRKDLEALVAKSVPSILGRLVRTTACAPDLSTGAAYGPIAFDKAGDLLVRTKDRILRVDRTSWEERPIDAALRWPTRLAPPARSAPPGDAPAWTLTAVEERCDAPTLVGRFETGGATVELPLPILTAARCVAGARIAVDLLGASSQGALFAVRGDVVAVPVEAPPRPVVADAFALAAGAAVELGAARSPEGGVVALTVPRGALVAKLKGTGRGASARLWTAPALDEAAACVPNDAADRIACAVKGAVAIYDAQ
jgi:hypothetical protein